MIIITYSLKLTVPTNAMRRGPVQSDTALEGESKSGNSMRKNIITYLDTFCE